MNIYDVIIIGGGPAGYKAALNLEQHGKRTLLIEENKVGGICLHKGCIPTKSLLNSVETDYASLDLDTVIRKKERDVLQLWKGLQRQLQKGNVALLSGRGKIRGKQGDAFIVSVNGADYQSRSLIIATGSLCRHLNINGLDAAMQEEIALNSDGFLDRTVLPDKILFVGGGAIGIEFATYAAKLKKEVYIIELLDNILNGMIDDDIRQILMKHLTFQGITVISGTSIEDIDGGNVVYRQGDKLDELSADLIVIASGRTGNIHELGLETLGVQIQNGFICADRSGRTNIPGVYACGDVIGKSMLAHSAYREAEVVVENICGIPSQMRYDAIPGVVFSDPEIAAAGLTESMCKKLGIEYYVKKCSMNYSSRYAIKYSGQQGVCKLIFSCGREIIGAQMIGNGSSEAIFSLADMISTKQTEDAIRSKIYPHPSMIEVIKAAVECERS